MDFLNFSMKTLLQIWTLMMWAGLVHGQFLKVLDKQSLLPVEYAVISCDNQKFVAFTDQNGHAEISAFPSNCNYEISSMGYNSITISTTNLLAENYIVYLQRSYNKMDEVVISSSRYGQRFRNVPSRIHRISPEQVRLQNPQTVADLLGNTGEIFIQKSQLGGGSPMIRGFSANRLLYAVDGIRMNTAIFRAGNLQNVISLDAFTMENSEVFFGPGSIIYGSDAVGGVMSFQTLTPKLSSDKKSSINTNAIFRYATANHEKTGHADFSYGGSKLAGITSITFSNFGDLRMGKNGPEEYLRSFYVERVNEKDSIISNPDPQIQIPTGYSQINFMQKLRYRPNDNWDLNYGFHLSETSEYSRYDRLIEIVNGKPRSAVWNYGPQKWKMHSLSVNYINQNKLFDQVVLRLALQQFEESRIDRNLSGNQRFRLRTQVEQVNAYSVNLDFEKQFGKHQLIYGAEYIFNDVASVGSALDIRNNNPIAVPDRYPASTWTSTAAYLTFQYNASEKLSLTSGIRFNAYSIKSDFTRHLSFFPFDFIKSALNNNAVTGSVGMVFRPQEDLKISISGSTGFRAPNVDDIGKIFDFGPREVVVPNANLKSEYAYNGEISILKYFGDNLTFDFSAYYTYLDNALVRRAFQVGDRDSILFNGELSKVFAVQNAAFGDVYGIQAGIEIKITNQLKFRTQYNYQIGKEELDSGEISRSRHAAPAFGVSRLSYISGKLTSEVYAQYSNEVSFAHLNEEERQKPAIYAIDKEGRPYSPAWYTLNLKAGYQFNNNFHLFFGLENILDQRYRPYSSGIVAPGRNGIVSIQIKF